MSKKRFVPLALLVLGSASFAADIPSAGSQLQQVPAAPELKKVDPEIRIERPDRASAPMGDDTRVTVNALRVTGGDLFAESDLIQASGFVPGSALTLGELRGMAAKIASYFQDRGYFLAQAYLPAQESRDGIITIAVLPGQYGKVGVQNRSRVSDTLVNQLTGGLDGQAVAVAPLERRLLLLSDLPGARVKSTLTPGASLGASDLLVDVEPGALITGSIDADNLGSRYTGRNRLGGTVNLNGLAGFGDVATLRAFTSADGLDYARASYQAQLGAAKLGLAFANLDYRLGKEFAALDAKGTAKIATLYGSYPLIRSRDSNLYAQANYDAKRFTDRADATNSVTDKDIDALTFNLNGDVRDNIAGGGASFYSLGWTHGKVDIQTPGARLLDDLSVRSNGNFNKLSFAATRLQNLVGRTTLYGSLSGQLASKNLDISEKMGIGGVGGVRAYPGGEAYGDEGVLATIELRHALPLPDYLPSGRFQVIGFYDIGTVTLNRNRFAAGDQRRTLSGAGVGLDWFGTNGLSVKMHYAVKTGNEDATSAPDKSGRFWVQAVKYF
jgi:hemolysin activation/secretion protein